jgi:hypothetical protein
MASTDSRPDVNVGARIPEDLRDELQALADRNERSFSGELRVAIRNWVDEQTSTPNREEQQP